MTTTDPITAIEQRLAQAVRNNEAALYTHIVEQDVPVLIARVRELEARYSEIMASAGEADWQSERLRSKLTAAEARALATEKERDAFKDDKHMIYGMLLAARGHADQLRAALAVAREVLPKVAYRLDNYPWAKKQLFDLLSQLPAEGAGTISDGGVEAVRSTTPERAHDAHKDTRTANTPEGNPSMGPDTPAAEKSNANLGKAGVAPGPSENLPPTSAGQPGEGINTSSPDAIWRNGVNDSMFHNPAGLSRDQIGAGYRPLTVEETKCVPEGAEYFDKYYTAWRRSMYVCHTADDLCTYRIRTSAHTSQAILRPLTGKWLTKCNSCGREYENGCGSSECCGAIQSVVWHDPKANPSIPAKIQRAAQNEAKAMVEKINAPPAATESAAGTEDIYDIADKLVREYHKNTNITDPRQFMLWPLVAEALQRATDAARRTVAERDAHIERLMRGIAAADKVAESEANVLSATENKVIELGNELHRVRADLDRERAAREKAEAELRDTKAAAPGTDATRAEIAAAFDALAELFREQKFSVMSLSDCFNNVAAKLRRE